MREELETPRGIDSLIDRLAPQDLAEEIRGDLYELYIKDNDLVGQQAANRKYIFNGLGFLAKRFFWKKSPTYKSNPFIMISSYFKMAKRSLLAYKGSSIINILGLTVGMASALIILSVIHFEIGFDKFHSNYDNLYRMVRVSGTDMSEFRTGISYPVPTALEEEIPGLQGIVSMSYLGDANIDVVDNSGTSVKKFLEQSGVAMVEPQFFSIFDFKGTGFRWISGNPEKALEEPYSVVLTKAMSKKYFGEEQALGQTLRLQNNFDCKITGVIEDLPTNTDFPFTVLVSYATLKNILGDKRFNNWSSVDDNHQSFVVLSPGTTKEDMEAQIAKVHAAHTNKDLHKFRHYLLQEFDEVHYDARFGNFNSRTISKQTILALAVIAIFLLLAASINYINLSTAQSSMRAKEIGLRKVLGGNRSALKLQFLTETFIIVSIAAIIGMVLAQLFLNNVQGLFDFNLLHTSVTSPAIVLSLVAMTIVITLLSGFYPALIISRFNPVVALRNKFATENIGGIGLRKILVVIQFTITQILVVGTFIVVSQMRFFQNVEMGFNREAIITTSIPDRDPNKRKVIEEQLRSQSIVQEVSFSSTLPSGINRNRSFRDIGTLEAQSMTDYHVYEYESIDPSFLDLYQIKLLAGRNLTEQDSVGNILINKTLMQNLNLGDPDEAVGKELKRGGGSIVTVVGIVDDFYSNSMKEGVDNIVMLIEPKAYYTLSVKIAAQQDPQAMQNTISTLEKIWTARFPEYIFDSQFFDENVRAFYGQERKYAHLFQLFSAIFLLIGCLGLYGLITFVINRKGKEVAVRKALGATFADIIFMFSREYVWLILISFLIAAPIAYFAVDSWLSNFAHHITLHWWLFIIPGLSVLFIALLVVTTKSMGLANSNPVDKLKYE